MRGLSTFVQHGGFRISPPTMSTPPVNQPQHVFHFGTLSIGLSASPVSFLTSSSWQITDPDNKTVYLCLLYRGLQFNALMVDPLYLFSSRVTSQKSVLPVRELVGWLFQKCPFLRHLLHSVSRDYKTKKYQCFTGNLMAKVCYKFVGQEYLMDIQQHRMACHRLWFVPFSW